MPSVGCKQSYHTCASSISYYTLHTEAKPQFRNIQALNGDEKYFWFTLSHFGAGESKQKNLLHPIRPLPPPKPPSSSIKVGRKSFGLILGKPP